MNCAFDRRPARPRKRWRQNARHAFERKRKRPRRAGRLRPRNAPTVGCWRVWRERACWGFCLRVGPGAACACARARSAPTDSGESETSSSLVLVRSDDDGLDAETWRERALAAEATAQKATAMLRTNLLGH